MCGIVGYISERPSKISGILGNAVFNSFRGDDGVGILYRDSDNKFKVEKHLYKLDEISTTTLDEKYIEKRKRIGSIEMTVPDKDTYNKTQLKFEKKMRELLDTKSKMVFIHHRKATYGDKTIKNLHPIYYNGKYYIHNGTAKIDSVKAWIQLHTKIEFTSETDTEVLAMLYNKLKTTLKGDNDKIFAQLRTMFPEGWGVLLEITKGGKITLIKDFARELWLYKFEDGLVLVSEPTPLISEPESLHLLKYGIMEINQDTVGEDYTKVNKQVNKWWVDALKEGDKIEEDSECEICKTKKNTLSTVECDEHTYGSVRKDICYECMVLKADESDDTDDEEQLDIIKGIYSNYIG